MTIRAPLRKAALMLPIAIGIIGCVPTGEATRTTDMPPPAVAPQPATSVGDPLDFRAAAEQAIERGMRRLLALQQIDGSWRSTKYGAMRGGVGNSALIVFALAHVPARNVEARAAAERGIRFLVSEPADEGFVRGKDGNADYPTYATALLLAALPRLGVDLPAGDVARMRNYLRAVQRGPRHGRGPEHPEFGGWNQTGGVEAELGAWDQSSISATRAALAGLAAGGALEPPTRTAALAYLKRCQNFDDAGASNSGDGGFFFTPDVTDPRNKAGRSSPNHVRSYGSATSDGLCAMIACGVPPEDPRRRAAVAWLAARFSVDEVPGFTQSVDRKPSSGVYYYYAAGLADALRRAPELDSAGRRARLAQAIVRRQRADGTWSNRSPLMYEDDPLIATALAITALGALCD